MHDLIEFIQSEGYRSAVWGLMLRGIGMIFFICFSSLRGDIRGLLGSRGIAPVHQIHTRMRLDLSFWQRLRLHPSCLWLADSDIALIRWLDLGRFFAIGVIVGGPWTFGCVLGCWFIMLSFKHPTRLHYPWDNALIESGFLAMFLPAGQLLPSIGLVATPSPIVAFLFHWLVFRILFGFGKIKFWGLQKRDWLYTRYFLRNMPMATSFGLKVARMPNWVHYIGLAYVGLVELVCPFFMLFASGVTRLICVPLVWGQMIGIQLTGNFGYFNLLTAILCLSALDPTITVWSAFASLTLPGDTGLFILGTFLTGAGLVHLLFDNWFAYGFLSWPAFERAPHGPLRWLIRFLRWVEPLRTVQAYGVFHARSAPPIRWQPVVEGTVDSENWKAFPYRFAVTHEQSKPPIVAPHHPRLDHLVFYDIFGLDGSTYFSVVSFSNPYAFSDSPMLDRIMQRVMEVDSPVLDLFGSTPFEVNPPKKVRVALCSFNHNEPSYIKETGKNWTIGRVGLHLPTMQPEPDIWRRWLHPPELFHFESTHWRRRAQSCEGISEEQYRAFWEEFIPFVKNTAAEVARGAHQPYAWEYLPGTVRAIRQRFSRDEVWAFRLTLGRLSSLILGRLDPVFSVPADNFFRDVVGLGEPAPRRNDLFEAPGEANPEDLLQALAAWPHGPVRSRFHLGVLVHRIILHGGQECLERLTAKGIPLNERLALTTQLPPSQMGSMSKAAAAIGLDLELFTRMARDMTIADGFFLEGIVNYDHIAVLSLRSRIILAFDEAFGAPPTGLAPGVVELGQELGQHPELRMMSGWGDEVVLEPPAVIPKMSFDEAGQWHIYDAQTAPAVPEGWDG